MYSSLVSICNSFSLLTLPCLDFELMKLMLRIFYKFSVVYSCLWPLNICVHIVSVGKKIKYDGFNSSFLQRFYNIGFIWIEMWEILVIYVLFSIKWSYHLSLAFNSFISFSKKVSKRNIQCCHVCSGRLASSGRTYVCRCHQCGRLAHLGSFF